MYALLLQLLLMLIALWSAHVAGACYARASEDVAMKRNGVMRTTFSIAATIAALMVHQS